jgi:hypothetical protein
MKNVFYLIDSWLPRPVNAIPYQMAEIDSAAQLQQALGPVKVWSRNSFKLNSFVFGISDLDLTVIGPSSNSFNHLTEILKSLKNKWPFIGETNVYHWEDLKALSVFINWYELNRDPELVASIPKVKIENLEVEKIVFLLRMLQSDASLENNPQYRQRKWKQHFSYLDLPHKAFIDRKTLLNTILTMLKGHELLQEALKAWDFERQSKDFEPFRAKLPVEFRILYPHQHLWFHSSSEISLENLSKFERQILKRQIDWEVWGLSTQRFFLDKENIKTHLGRLMKAYISVAEVGEHKLALSFLNHLGI